ncbi:hypothetical protein [Rubrivivax gelatinosus]|uniref:hypothetical protein n=1 Tax=Rubrivivax gelatinosus TaxID=28068 RepID=UPI0005C16D8D|nr:hypothetical protein [Rubrivivax gelatinosus]MBG6083208.1 hypothetical protein [Rubrivivax gelatinosus]
MNSPCDTTFDRAAYRDALLVPITFGPARLRATLCQRALVDESGGERDNTLASLREQLAAEARTAGVVPDMAFLTKCVDDLLSQYERSFAEYQANRGEHVGHVFELSMPSGRTVLMSSAQTLRKLGLLRLSQ